MFNNLPQDIKDSISQSISTAFKQYMKEIEWNDNKYDYDDFKKAWKDYAKQASWYGKIDRETYESTEFQEELTEEMDEIVEGIFKEKPTQDATNELDSLIEKLNLKKINYCSKAEVEYYLEKLKNM